VLAGWVIKPNSPGPAEIFEFGWLNCVRLRASQEHRIEETDWQQSRPPSACAASAGAGRSGEGGRTPGYQFRHEGPTRSLARNRQSVLPENHRWAPLQNENGPCEEENHSAKAPTTRPRTSSSRSSLRSSSSTPSPRSRRSSDGQKSGTVRARTRAKFYALRSRQAGSC
jgi:hypothetical protein